METSFCSHKDPIVPSLSSEDTLCSTYTAVTLVCVPFPPWKPYSQFILLLTLHYNVHCSHLVYRNLILSRAHLWGKAQTIYPFIQLVSVAEQIAGKTAELTLDHRSYSHDSKKVTLPVALKKASWSYWTVQKGITNHYDLLVLPTHSEIWVNMSPTLCTLWVLECER